MARPVYQYQPFNQNPDKALGILLPLNKPGNSRAYNANYASGSADGGGVFISSYTTFEQSVSNLKMLLLTRVGERLMQPEYGTPIQSILFENMTGAVSEKLQDGIQSALDFWLPYIVINSLDLFENRNDGSILVRLSTDVTNVGANVVINLLANENDIVIIEDEEVLTDDEGNLFAPGTLPPAGTALTQVGTTFNTFGTSY